MSWFSRGPKPDFWRVAPFDRPAEVLYQYGISSVGRQDGRAMMAAGWAIWHRAGMHAHQADDFLRDGYDLWRQDDGCTDGDARRFLRDLRHELDRQPRPSLPADPMRDLGPTGLAAGAHYGMRSWAAAEEWTLTPSPERGPDLRAEISEALTRTHPAYLSARSANLARAFADGRGASG